MEAASGGFLSALLALGASISFGVQYVPVKKYEIYDGTTFQWFMCSGIMMMGFVLSLCFGSLEQEPALPVIFGGMLWGLSNYCVLPLVKLLGIGLGFSLYHFVNLMVGYLIGRFGFFGIPRLQGDPIAFCDVGCALVLVSFVVMVFVEDHERGACDEEPLRLDAALFPDADEEYRRMYAWWRRGSARGARDPPVRSGAAAQGPGSGIATFGRFSAADMDHAPGRPIRHLEARRQDVASPQGRPAGPPEAPVQMPAARSASDGSPPTSAALRSFVADAGQAARPRSVGGRVFGVTLAIVGGVICALQSVPAAVYNAQHKGVSSSAVVFPQSLGIWVASTSIYLLYASFAKLAGWSVPHSVIRPAFISGIIWCLGFAFMIGTISRLGYSIGYTLGAVGPIMVSSLLSVFVFREIRGRKQLTLYAMALAFQVTGTGMIASFGPSQR